MSRHVEENMLQFKTKKARGGVDELLRERRTVEDYELNPPLRSTWNVFCDITAPLSGTFGFATLIAGAVGADRHYLFWFAGALALVTFLTWRGQTKRKPLPLASRKLLYERTLQNGKNVTIDLAFEWPI